MGKAGGDVSCDGPGQDCKVLGIYSSWERAWVFYTWLWGIFQCLLMAPCGQPEMLSELTTCVSTVTVLLNASLYVLSGKKLKSKHSPT